MENVLQIAGEIYYGIMREIGWDVYGCEDIFECLWELWVGVYVNVTVIDIIADVLKNI